MKARFRSEIRSDNTRTEILEIEGTTEEEKYFLRRAYLQGLRVFAITSGYKISLALPSAANLKQIHLRKELFYEFRKATEEMIH